MQAAALWEMVEATAAIRAQVPVAELVAILVTVVRLAPVAAAAAPPVAPVILLLMVMQAVAVQDLLVKEPAGSQIQMLAGEAVAEVKMAVVVRIDGTAMEVSTLTVVYSAVALAKAVIAHKPMDSIEAAADVFASFGDLVAHFLLLAQAITRRYVNGKCIIQLCS